MSSRPFALYNPALLPPDDLLAEFTARLPMLETLLGIIRGNQAGHPSQHCLLIGARGMGKTTTLWAISHRVDRDAALAARWQPVVFDEESRRVGDLADFWLECIRQWEHAVRSPGGLADRLLEETPADIEDRAREGLLKLVDQSGKRALLLIDNLNDVLSSIRDLEPLHRLRAFLMQDPRVMVIGGATRHFDAITSLDQPFYEFFRCFELRPLTAEEMETCLLAHARNRGDTSIETTLKERQGTVRALHLLTGGNPRLVKTFYRLLAEGLRGDIRADLERLMDEFTPYFKAIVDALPTQQQRIFDAVALAWDPVEVARLATATRLPSNQVSAQLRSLAKAGLVREAAGGPKRKTYLLTDRFSNIHYLMRHGRAARNRLDWFVALVRIVFPDRDSADILAKAARAAAECGPEGRLDARSVLHSALSRSDSVEGRRNLMHATLREGWGSSAWESLTEWFDAERAHHDLPEIDILSFCQSMPAPLRKELGFKPNDARWWYRLTSFLREKQAWPATEAACRRAIELDPKYSPPWNGLGNLFQEYLDRPAEAEAAYRKSIELNPKNSTPWNGLGNLLQTHLGRPAEAEPAYRKSIELNPKNSPSWNNLGNLLQNHLARPAEAEAAYRKAIELDSKYALPWNNLGALLLNHLGRPAEAEAAFRKSIGLGLKLAHPWYGLANVLSQRASGMIEARACAAKGVSLKPDHGFARSVFLRLCGDRAEAWREVLANVVAWYVTHPKADVVFDFAVDGFLRLARLTKPSEALALMDSLPDAAPFQTVRDAFVAHGNRDHLLTLAPERQNIALALLDRIASPQPAPVATEKKRKVAKPAKKIQRTEI